MRCRGQMARKRCREWLLQVPAEEAPLERLSLENALGSVFTVVLLLYTDIIDGTRFRLIYKYI